VRPRHVYVHVPFCGRRCSYCDFAIAVRRRPPVDEFLRAITAELELRYPPGEPWRASTLYLGGGTPSRLGADGVERLLSIVRRRLRLEPDAEVTLEANPDDVTRDAVVRWCDAGVNRLSLGVQSFDDRALRWMHRTHDAGQALRALDAARGGGIANVSADLIFALPAGLERSWSRNLSQVVQAGVPHVSLYGLTIEERTPLGRWIARGAAAEAPEETYEAEFLLAHEVMTAAGFEHYEVSSFAHPGARSRHNASYWSGAAYAGLGPSAHEFDGERRRWNVSGYAQWVGRLADGCDPVGGAERLSRESKDTEAVYLGLRTSEGLALDEVPLERARRWVDAGWATVGGGRLRLTAAGWLRLDALAADLTLARSHS
jgi:oxygen-independent coproporphyrinogen III oxidase